MANFRKKPKVKKPPRLTFEQKQTDIHFLRATIKNLRKAVRKLSKRVKELEPPIFHRPSQNQTASSGVEGAHEGNTADKSEPEKLNNAEGACIYCAGKGPLAKLSVALAESSLSSPPPKCRFCNHSLVDNSHGFDQNDARLCGVELVHSGRCTYCRECNPRIFKAASPELLPTQTG